MSSVNDCSARIDDPCCNTVSESINPDGCRRSSAATIGSCGLGSANGNYPLSDDSTD